MAGRMRTKAIPPWAPSPPDISPARFREGAPPMRIRRSVERPARPRLASPHTRCSRSGLVLARLMMPFASRSSCTALVYQPALAPPGNSASGRMRQHGRAKLLTGQSRRRPRQDLEEGGLHRLVHGRVHLLGGGGMIWILQRDFVVRWHSRSSSVGQFAIALQREPARVGLPGQKANCARDMPGQAFKARGRRPGAGCRPCRMARTRARGRSSRRRCCARGRRSRASRS